MRNQLSRRTSLPLTLGSVVMLSIGGLLFWLLVAQRCDDSAVGAGAKLFSATFFLAFIAQLGLPILVTRYATDQSDVSSRITSVALAVVACSGVAIACLFVAVAPVGLLAPLGGRTLTSVLLLAIFVSSVSISTVVDARLLALSQVRAYALRLALITVFRLLSIICIPESDDGSSIFICSVFSFGLSSVFFIRASVQVESLGSLGREAEIERPDLRAMAYFSLSNYFGQLAFQAPILLVPFLVAFWDSEDAFSKFYVAWNLSTVLLVALVVLGQTFLAEVSASGWTRSQSGFVTVVGVGLSLVASVLMLAVGRPIVSALYGPSYELVGTLLPWLTLGCGPAAVLMIVLNEARYAERNLAVNAISVPYALIVCLGTIIGAKLDGTYGASVAWLIGNLVSLLPTLLVRKRLHERIVSDRWDQNCT